jgi:hypothetical protein
MFSQFTQKKAERLPYFQGEASAETEDLVESVPYADTEMEAAPDYVVDVVAD